MNASSLASLIEVAATRRKLNDYERPLFELLEREIGFDVAFCIREDGIGPHAPGFDAQVRERTAGRFDCYAEESAQLKYAALSGTGVAAARSLLTVCELAVSKRRDAKDCRVQLTPRERELLRYLRLGYTNREIAQACGTSFRMVRNQLSRVFDRLEVSTRSEAVARSFELALPSTEQAVMGQLSPRAPMSPHVG
jgi:DNA-binding CsgD family transcriptional regulator